MLNEVIEIFEKKLDTDGEDIVYGKLRGTYVLVNKDCTDYEIYHATGDKDVDISEIGADKYREISKKDFMSRMLLSDSNKAIDSKKKVHSTNYMTFFIKKESLINYISNPKKEKEEIDLIIDRYFECIDKHINNAGKYKKEIDMYEAMFKSIGVTLKDKNEDIFNINREWIRDNLLSVCLSEKYNLSSKGYLNIFFDIENEEIYENEYYRYCVKKVFTSNKHNVLLDEIVYGLHSGNMTLNDNKPSLFQGTRKNQCPCLVTLKKAMLINKFFAFLKSFDNGINTLYLNDDGIYETYIDKKDGARINNLPCNLQDFNGYVISWSNGEINKFDIVESVSTKSIKEFKVENILNVKLGEKDFNFYDKTIDKIESLEHIVNTILFNSHLCKNYYSEKVEIDNLFYQDLITSIRDAMYKWFVVGDSRAGYRALSKSFDRILINAITSEVIDNKNSSNPSKSINKIFNKTKNKLNLVYALRKYFEGDEFIMENNINSIREKLSEKIASKDISLVENDKEYYYAVGQISMYLIKLKSTNRICHSELNAILKCKTDVKLKEELIRTYKKYNFKIFTNYIKFQKLYSMVLGYNPTSKIDTQVLLFGALQDSILFNNEVDKNEEIKTIEESVN